MSADILVFLRINLYLIQSWGVTDLHIEAVS